MDAHPGSAHGAHDSLKEAWAREQSQLAQLVVEEDAVDWVLQEASAATPGRAHPSLALIGGLDISFFPANGNQQQLIDEQHGQPVLGEQGIAALVVLTFPELQVVYSDCQPLPLQVPYLPGYLGFREVPAFQLLLDRVRSHEGGRWTPQVLLVDGCGVLHPKGCGSASHVGVTSHIPTIGVAKNLLAVDGLQRLDVEQHLQHLQRQERAGRVDGTSAGHPHPAVCHASPHTVQSDSQSDSQQPLTPVAIAEDAVSVALRSRVAAGQVVMALRGESGRVWGAALTTASSKKPLYISSGHRVSLGTAVQLVSACCVHRVPEPIRQADLRSREAVRICTAARASHQQQQ